MQKPQMRGGTHKRVLYADEGLEAILVLNPRFDAKVSVAVECIKQ